MIETPQTWIAKKAGLLIAILLALLCAVALFIAKSCSDARTAKTRTTLSENQTGAAVASGQDAVNTVGNTQANETATHETVKGSQDEIAQAKAGDSNDAAQRATCRMRSYRNSSRCIALLGPVAR